MTVHPAPYRIKLARSSVDPRDDEQTDSGLHVVRNVEPADHAVLRGVVEEIGPNVDDEFPDLAVGHVLFYLQAIRLGGHDFVVASYENIVGWED